MNWDNPRDEHIIYEAFSALVDNRFEIVDEKTAHCYSTSRNKFYIVTFDFAEITKPKIMSNDKMAFFMNEVSYPMIALLFEKGILEFDRNLLSYFKDIRWKDINQKNKNDYMKSVSEVLDGIEQEGGDRKYIESHVSDIFKKVCALKIELLGDKKEAEQIY